MWCICLLFGCFIGIRIVVIEAQMISIGNCGVDPSRDCSSVHYSNAAIIHYHNEGTSTYTLDKTGAEEITNHILFDIFKETVIFIHGYTRTPESPGSVAIKDAFLLKNETVNYLAVNGTDALNGSMFNVTRFKEVADESPCFGLAIAKFIVRLNENGVSEDSLYLVGHSLGAPIASFAARTFTEITNKKIYRITALDSVGPCFYPNTTIQPQQSDAQLVDAMHTNMNIFASSTQLGRADVYPNGGTMQPSCMGLMSMFDITCSHAFALFLYAESVNSDSCIGAHIVDSDYTFLTNATSTAIVGYNWINEIGSFYLSTNADSPYCRGKDGY